MAMSPPAKSLSIRIVDTTRGVARELRLDPHSIVPNFVPVGVPESDGMPTLIAVERIISKINRSGFSLIQNESRLLLAEHVNRHYLAQSSQRWGPSTVELCGSVMVTPAAQEVGEFVHNLRKPLLPGAEQFIRASADPDPNAVPALADFLIETTRSRLRPSKAVWNSRGPEIVRFVGRCALEGIIGAIFGAPVGIFLNQVLS